VQYLDVPFTQKEQAKALGARWDPLKKKWYLPDADKLDLTPFQAWLPAELDSALDRVNAVDDRETISLSELLRNVQLKLQQSFQHTLWVKAEIANLSERKGHWYLELSENNDEGQTLASCRAMLWASTAVVILAEFNRVTGSELAEGQKVLVQVQVNFHERFGFSLVVVGIDPSFTLGAIEANLIAIRQALIKQGIYHQNKQFAWPTDFFRIAVIAPPKAAGLGDFRVEADRLAQQGVCEFVYFYSGFQGESAVDELQTAFEAALARHEYQAFDALVLIRGGGAKLDLNPLNHLVLAQWIAQAPLPVLTGIGHERDNTILDEVANRRFDTPSKVIAAIYQQLVISANQTRQAWQDIQQLSRLQIHQSRASLVHLKQQTRHRQEQQLRNWQTALTPIYQQIQYTSLRQINAARMQLDYQVTLIHQQAWRPIQPLKQRVDECHQWVSQAAQQQIHQQRQACQQWIGFIMSSGPQTQLKRGFALAKTATGQPILMVQSAIQAKHFNLEFADGTIPVKVDK